MTIPVISRIVPLGDSGAFSVIDAGDLGGAFVKSATTNGALIVQLSDGTEANIQLATASGVTVTTGTEDPTGGSAGDIYLQLNASDQIIAIWENESGTWAEYGLMGDASDGTVLNGNGAPAGNSGKDGDTYRDDESGAWYKKASGAWSAALYTPTAAGISLAADFPIVADAVAGTWYGDGTPTPEAVGFLGTLGETHVSAFRTAYLGKGFYGFAKVAGSAGPVFKKGGDVAPLPEGLLTLAFHVSSLTSNGLFVDVDTAAGLFMAELTSVEVSITRDGMTAQTYLLTTVTEVETGIRRFQDHFTVPSGTKLYEAGEHNLVSFVLSSSADPVEIHGGTAIVKVVDDLSFQAERAAIHQEIAPLEEELERFETQYLGANLHGDLFDIDNPLDLNHQEIISDDLVVFRFSHGTLAENPALNNRYVGQRVTVGNEELYLTQYQQFMNPEVHISYKAVVMELDADGRVETVTSSLTLLSNRDNSQEFSFNFIDTGITLKANTSYSIGIMQYGGFTELNLGVLEFTTANSQDPVVAPDIPQNADDIVLGRIDRVTSGSTSWRPGQAIGHLLTAGPANHRQGKPNFVFHKSLSALFINPPNLALQNAGFEVETVDINNKVKVIDFSSDFVVPDSQTEKVMVRLTHNTRIPNPTNATDGYVWTADGADGAGWEDVPAGINGTDGADGTDGTDGTDGSRRRGWRGWA